MARKLKVEEFIKNGTLKRSDVENFVHKVGAINFFEQYFGEKAYFEIIKNAKKMSEISKPVKIAVNNQKYNAPETKIGKMLDNGELTRDDIEKFVDSIGAMNFIEDYFKYAKMYSELVQHVLNLRVIRGIEKTEAEISRLEKMVRPGNVRVKFRGFSLIEKDPTGRVILSKFDERDLINGRYTIPKMVTHIGTGAFTNCNHLKEVTLPENVVAIGNVSFKGCAQLKTVHIIGEKSRKEIHVAPNAFDACNIQKSITKRLTKVGKTQLVNASTVTPL